MLVMHQIPVKNIELTPFNCRKIDENHVSNLAIQIRNGVFMPAITCRPSRIKEGHYEVIQGQHRLEAFKKLGYNLIMVKIKDLNDDDVFSESMKENITNNHLNRNDLWRIAYHLYKTGMSVQNISCKLNKCSKTVTQYICAEYYLSDDIKKQHKLPQSIIKYLCKISKPYQLGLLDELKDTNSKMYAVTFKKYQQLYPNEVQPGTLSKIK